MVLWLYLKNESFLQFLASPNSAQEVSWSHFGAVTLCIRDCVMSRQREGDECFPGPHFRKNIHTTLQDVGCWKRLGSKGGESPTRMVNDVHCCSPGLPQGWNRAVGLVDLVPLKKSCRVVSLKSLCQTCVSDLCWACQPWMKEASILCGVTLSCHRKCACQMIVGPPFGWNQTGSDAHHSTVRFCEFKTQNTLVLQWHTFTCKA